MFGILLLKNFSERLRDLQDITFTLYTHLYYFIFERRPEFILLFIVFIVFKIKFTNVWINTDNFYCFFLSSI